MRYWLQLPQGGWVASQRNVRLYALLAEELGFHGVWMGDHIVIPVDYESQYPYGELHPVPPDRPVLEAYTTLAYVAGLTRRIRLAVTVSVIPYRHPLLHAKVVATLDHLSAGRLEVGIGTGWLREEFQALGADYARRQRITDEHLEAMRQLWTGEPVSFQGETVSFPRVQCQPRPAQLPHPPLWIGGASSWALRRVKRYGAGWLAPELPGERFDAIVASLSQRCASAGQKPPGVSAKVWLEPAVGAGGTFSLHPRESGSLAVLERLAAAGTTDVRIDLSRLPTRDRTGCIHHLARLLEKEGYLDVG